MAGHSIGEVERGEHGIGSFTLEGDKPMEQQASRSKMSFIGAGSGVVASLSMSALMLAAQKAGLTGKLPPRKITQRALNALRVPRGKKTDGLSTFAAHLGYGSAAGAFYSTWLKGRFLPRNPVAEGMLFGTALWAASYFGWVPAMKILPMPTKDRPGRSLTVFVGHLVYGAVLGFFGRRRRFALDLG